MPAVERTARDPTELAGPHTDGPRARLLPADADPFFRAERVRPDSGPVTLDAGFCILTAVGGEGRVDEVGVRRGHSVLVPHAAGEVKVSGTVELIRSRPPAPDAGGPPSR